MPLPEFNQLTAGQRRPEYLAWMSVCIAHNIHSYVELGTGSSHYFRQAGIMRVIAVDINNGEDPLHNAHRETGVVYLQGNSHDPATLDRVCTILGGDPDAVFIDADHDYEPVKSDFALWWPHTQKLVGFHDILIPGVREFWREISLDISSVKLIGCDYDSARSWQGDGAPRDGVICAGGIGVLFK
jgi:hypothetical protein